MTVLAGEAAEGAASRAGFARSSAGPRKRAPRKTALQSHYEAESRKPRRYRPVEERAVQTGAETGGETGGRVKSAASSLGSQAAYVGGNARLTPGSRGYQPVLLAEFLAAVVIVALVPVAAGGSPAAKAKGSPSPYDAGDLGQLVAVGAVYFILALASSGNSGRVSAWFGGLVLIGLTIVKLSGGQLGQVFATVSGQKQDQGDKKTAQQGKEEPGAQLRAVRRVPRVGRVGR